MSQSLRYIPVLLLTICLCFGQFALAQDEDAHTANATARPAICVSCVLFYGGDFDANNPNANALANELTTSVVSGATVFVPFVVPAGKTWVVNALFANSLSYTSVIDPKEAIWSIETGMSQGNGGTVVANGAAPAQYIPTGGGGFGMKEYLLLATIDPPITLPAGEYWMSVVPECKNPVDRACAAASYYMADVEDLPRHHARGYEPNDDAFYFSGEFGYFYWPTWGATGACHGSGCDRFSAGVEGTEQ